ncbi:DUF2975 domain-containing protein [Methylocystis sp. B8]|nr:DUF2975 domain-containing protein [Methylocystis sp. B8]
MTNVVQIPQPMTPLEPARRQAIRRRSAQLAAALTWTFFIALCATALLTTAVLFYDGPMLSFGPGGLWIGHGPDPALGRVSLSTFTFAQRLAGALAIAFLTAPVLAVVHYARRLFQLYAEGVVFTPANARLIKSMAVGLAAYAFAPFAANRTILLAGLTNDPVWFHADEVLALVFGALAYVVADVMEFGHEIERDRDGFI